MKTTVIFCFFIALTLVADCSACYSGDNELFPPPPPVRIGGSITVDGILLTAANSAGLTVRATKPDGSAFIPPAQDLDGLSAAGWYSLDIPVFDPVTVPGGAAAGSPVRLRVYRENKELTVITPENGLWTMSTTGSVVRLDLVLRSDHCIGGFCGAGLANPERALHLAGGNAVFRMDRPANASAFLMVRTDTADAIQKGFLAGTEASGVNDGQFVFRDTGMSVADGAGMDRLTIQNDGTVVFDGDVTAKGYITTSTVRRKENIVTLENAAGLLGLLQGVRFRWKPAEAGLAGPFGGESTAGEYVSPGESPAGQPADVRPERLEIGLIAEAVAPVIPEAVLPGAAGGLGADYLKLLAVVLETVKSQQARLDEIARKRDDIRQKLQKTMPLE